jgi:hypothetical protein
VGVRLWGFESPLSHHFFGLVSWGYPVRWRP